jgi:hypothetical protein
MRRSTSSGVSPNFPYSAIFDHTSSEMRIVFIGCVLSSQSELNGFNSEIVVQQIQLCKKKMSGQTGMPCA